MRFFFNALVPYTTSKGFFLGSARPYVCLNLDLPSPCGGKEAALGGSNGGWVCLVGGDVMDTFYFILC